MRLRTAAFLVVLVALLCVPVVARADDGPVLDAPGDPGTVQPVNVAHVRLESEAVQIVVYSAYAECHADFRLVNTGPPRTMRVGFPSVSDPKGDTYDVPQDLGDFRAWQNGRPLPVRAVPGRDGPLTARFYEHTIALPTGVTTVTVDYIFRTDDQYDVYDPPAQPAAPLRWLGMGGEYHKVDYILHTGALWSGTIGRAVVRVTFDDSCERFGEDAFATNRWATTPGWTKPDPRTFQWVFRDFEPTQDRTSGRSPFDIRLGYERPTWDAADADEQYDEYDGDDPDWEAFAMWRAWWVPPFVSDMDSADSDEDLARTYDQGRQLHNYGTPFDDWFGGAWGVRGNALPDTWFEADFGQRSRVREIRIIPGSGVNGYQAYSRPKVLMAQFSDGSTQVLHLTDDPRLQCFPVDVETDSVVLRVESVYRGTTDPDVIAVMLADVGPTPSPRFLPFAEALQLAGAPLPSLRR